MSLCQLNETTSCGACCGFFNLEIEKEEYKKLLEDRTNEYKETVELNKPWTVAGFRKKRESIEEKIPRKDDTIYNCPFMGYLDEKQKRIGCMIHPFRTGDSRSQNFSFYGTSICQAYDCKNKERPTKSSWISFWKLQNLTFYEYSLLVSDHITIDRIENFFFSCGLNLETTFLKYSDLIVKLLFRKFTKDLDLLNQTSFEIDMETDTIGREFELLCERLKIERNEETYEVLKRIKHPV